MKRLLVGIVVILLIAIGWIVYYIYPHNISITMKGMEYQLGKASGHVIPITLAVDGKLSHSLFGGKTFQGIIRISGSTVPNPDNNRQLTIRFPQGEDYSSMVYGYWQKNGIPVNHGYGQIFTNHDFSKMTIIPWPKGAGFSWENGLMISAPAQDRPQALTISNGLMHNFMNGYVLK